MKGNSPLFSKVKYKASSADISFMGDGDRSEFAKFISKRKDIDINQTLDVIAHGNKDEIEIIHNNETYFFSARELARLLEKTPNFKNYKAVRLFSCNTGSNDTGFAQNLSNKLGMKVYAPNKYIWSYNNGVYFIASRDKKGQPNLSDKGKFREFIPGGNKR